VKRDEETLINEGIANSVLTNDNRDFGSEIRKCDLIFHVPVVSLMIREKVLA
jgi:hypothetical protein